MDQTRNHEYSRFENRSVWARKSKGLRPLYGNHLLSAFILSQAIKADLASI